MTDDSPPPPTMWDAINVAQPDLPYKQPHLLRQDRGSTTWAAHSHTPPSVRRWDEFDSVVQHAARRTESRAHFSINVAEKMNNTQLKKVSEELHVTNCIDNLLQSALEQALPDIEFAQTDQYTLANPDMVAIREETELIVAREYESRANSANARAIEKIKAAPRIVFETKPFWKFPFLINESADSTAMIINLWGVSGGGNSAHDMRNQKPLPLEP